MALNVDIDHRKLPSFPTRTPPYSLFRSACRSGLSVVRPLTETARDRDPCGFNFGSGWPPSYAAYGRLRSLWTLQLALALQPNRALEVAANDASLSACLAAAGISVVANDLRSEALKDALGCFKLDHDITILPGNLFDLDPSQTGTFDLVMACEVIEHVAHPDDLLCHLKRFLAPKGRLLLTTPNGAYFRSKLPTYFQIQNPRELEAMQFRPDADGHLFLLTPAELQRLAAQAEMCVEYLDLWGTPFITGHCGFAKFQGKAIARFCYLLEQTGQRLPSWIGERFCASMFALLAASD